MLKRMLMREVVLMVVVGLCMLTGRRRFNELRQQLARERQQQVLELWLAWGDYWGVVTKIADELRVSKSTISRDLARLRQEWGCPMGVAGIMRGSNGG
jgi:predicted DNA-binding transcriptional regulator YafY